MSFILVLSFAKWLNESRMWLKKISSAFMNIFYCNFLNFSQNKTIYFLNNLINAWKSAKFPKKISEIKTVTKRPERIPKNLLPNQHRIEQTTNFLISENQKSLLATDHVVKMPLWSSNNSPKDSLQKFHKLKTGEWRDRDELGGQWEKFLKLLFEHLMGNNAIEWDVMQ